MQSLVRSYRVILRADASTYLLLNLSQRVDFYCKAERNRCYYFEQFL